MGDVGEIDAILARLARSPFRSRFRLGAKERAYLAAKGLEAILDHGRQFIDRRLAPASPRNNGRQTPFRGHPVFIAQHATATCCRSCLEKWHGIPHGRALQDRECAHVMVVLERWLRARCETQP